VSMLFRYLCDYVHRSWIIESCLSYLIVLDMSFDVTFGSFSNMSSGLLFHSYFNIFRVGF